MKKVGLWISGLIASGVTGGVITVVLIHPSRYETGQWLLLGLIGGACAFACARLWLAENSR